MCSGALPCCPLLLSAPQVEIGTLDPYEYNQGEKEDEEEEEAVELPLKPLAIPQGSGGSGVLMGPNTQKGLKKHIHLRLCIHKQKVT